MINPAAMMGLDNAPAYKELREIKQGITTLFNIKIKDTKSIELENKRQREQDKRDNQDVKRVLNQDRAVMQQMGANLENSQAGLMAALLGGAALFGAAKLLGGFDLGQFVNDVSTDLYNFLTGKDKVDEPTLNESDVPTTQASPGSDADTEVSGGVEELSQTDDPKSDKVAKQLPLPKTVTVTSKPGWRGNKVHTGIDIGGVGGEKLTVSKPSKVVESRFIKGYGNTVIFKDSRGEHLYAHMQALSKFKPGDTVQPGQTIGRLGNTGRSTGPHLHWEFSPKLNVVGRPRGMNETVDPSKTGGMSWKTPFTGHQSGGVVGKALHMIKDHEAIASLTPGERDWVRPGMQKSTGSSKRSYSSLEPGTLIHPYRDRGSKKTPTIGWGTTYLGGMMKGTDPVTMKTPPMFKKRADAHLEKDVTQLTGHLAKTVKPWKKLSDDQKSGLISIGYNAGPNAHTSKNPKFAKYGKAIQSGNIQEAVKKDVMPHFESRKDRRMDEISLLKSGPQQVTGFQRGGVVGKQSGGLINLMNTEKQPESFDHYTSEFYERQAKKVTGSSIIIVNKTAPPRTPSLPHTKDAWGGTGDDDTPSYSDIAQTFYRYVGGIKI